MVENNMITNCNINADDIKQADVIWGPAKSVLQGKMKRKTPITYNKIQKLTLPLSVSQQHKQITMYIDIFYVNRNSFFLIKNRETKFLVWNQAKIKEQQINNKCNWKILKQT